jgi:FixJ family two-component response regulator
VQDFSSVCIVDDETSHRFALMTFLRTSVCKASEFGVVEKFETADEFLSPARVVTDIWLPRLPGVDVMRPPGRTRPDAPVIIIPAWSESALLANALGSGADCLLQKRFAGDALVRCIKGALEGRLVPD